jgi:hypothetical protein
MTTNVLSEHRDMRKPSIALLVALAGLAWPSSALPDQEASNIAHVAAGPYGRCYAKSVPAHVYDPDGEPRQQGHTRIYRVNNSEDVLIHQFDWFSQKIFLKCGISDDTVVIRVGALHRGHNPRADHLAIAFYKGGKLLKRYSTLEIAGGKKAIGGGLSRYGNVSTSVSHYTVFASEPEMVKMTKSVGPVFQDNWVIKAKTVDGRSLVFDIATGKAR